MNIYFKEIRVINPSDNLDMVMNLWIKDGIIEHCDTAEAQTDSHTEIIDGKDLVCSPGFFDMHVHLREPGQEYKEDIQTGTAAAANGGFTGICCMPNTDPVIDHVSVVELIKQRSKNNLVDVSVAAAMTQGLNGELLTSMMELNENGVELFTDDGKCVKNPQVMRRIFEYSATKDLLVSQHAEDHDLTSEFSMNESELSLKLGLKGYPSVAEDIIVARDIMLAEYCGNRRYHVQHISSAGAVELVRAAKAKNLRISCEVSPHHIALTEDMVNYHTNFKMNPPLRTVSHREALLEGLRDGTIEIIATDHAPHALHEKDVEYELAPNGIIGLETAVGVCITYLVEKGVISLSQFIEKISVNPRKLLKLKEIKISKGEIANITILAPKENWEVKKEKFLSMASNSPFVGLRLTGKPKFAINNKQIHKSVL